MNQECQLRQIKEHGGEDLVSVEVTEVKVNGPVGANVDDIGGKEEGQDHY